MSGHTATSCNYAVPIAIGVTLLNLVQCVYRLPKDVKPVRYALTMEPLIMDEWADYTFTGGVVIELKIVNNTKNIVLHSRSLEIDATSILVERESDVVNVLGTSSDRVTETYTIHLQGELVKGDSYNLTIGRFSGHLGNSHGLFYARYWTANASRRTIAATNFEPAGARRAFPCFDEPALKAKFTVSLIRKEQYTSLSNEELESIEHLGYGRFKDTFKETPEMSTFLVAFAVSDLKSTAKSGKQRVFGRVEIVERGELDYALGVATQALRILEDYTGINYTLSKMDHFAVPDGYFPFSAMENWGLTIYGEKHLRVSSKSSMLDLQRTTTYIAHELAHQWFGNLVTPEWWDYLWLSESLAAYFQYYVASLLLPRLQLMHQFVVDVVQFGFIEEEFAGATPLNHQTQYAGEIPPLHIIYQKGNSVVRMMSHFLGHDIFQQGLRFYLQDRKFSTAVPCDLYDALQEAVDGSGAGYLLQGLSVAEIMETWDTNVGFPTVTVTRNYVTGSLLFEQSSIFNQTENTWYIPINYVFSSNPDFSKTTADFWLTEKCAVINSKLPTTGWLLVNKQETGYYRVNYDLENWERIIRFLKSDEFRTIHALNRAQLIGDAFYFAYHKDIPFDIPLRLSEYLKKERDSIPLAAFNKSIRTYLHIHRRQWAKDEYEYLQRHPLTSAIVTAGETLYECNRIEYFSKEKYSPDPNDSTLAIPYAVTKSIFFFILASFLLCCSYCCCIVGQCIKHRRLYTFISGVSFIVSGLIMLLGLIMYISVFKAEVGSKLRPRSHIQPPAFTYNYGFSFLLYVSGFISTQLAGISAVFLFIYRMQHEWRRKHLEDIRRGKVHTPPPSVNYLQLDHNMFYPCRRHPQAYINSNSSIHVPINFPSPVRQRRYFFSKDPIPESPCSLHRNLSQSNSLKDISSSFYDFPPPPTISYQFEELKSFNRDTSRHFPRDITTNTVSTTADINCDDFLPEPYDDYSPSIQHEHEFVTFDLDQPLPLRAQSTVSVNSRNDNGRKDFGSDTLRRTTPV